MGLIPANFFQNSIGVHVLNDLIYNIHVCEVYIDDMLTCIFVQTMTHSWQTYVQVSKGVVNATLRVTQNSWLLPLILLGHNIDAVGINMLKKRVPSVSLTRSKIEIISRVVNHFKRHLRYHCHSQPFYDMASTTKQTTKLRTWTRVGGV